MNDFILEDKILEVPNSKTREYLKEITSTYQHGDYRSCIVTLYVLVIFDLLEKIKIQGEFVDFAKEYIEKYKDEMAKNRHYSDIEKDILQKSRELQLISEIEKEKIEELRKLRHHCAHPSVDIENGLYCPNKDEVRAKIRCMYESVFLKEPCIIPKMFDSCLDEIVVFFNNYGESSLEEYLLKRYFKKMNAKTREKFLRELWYRIFLNTKDVNNRNKEVYFYTIIHLLKSYEELTDYIKEHSDGFIGTCLCNNLAKSKTKGNGWYKFAYDNIAFTMFKLLQEFPKIYSYFTDEIKIIIKEFHDININFKLQGFFLYPTLEEHANALIEYMKCNYVAGSISEIYVLKLYEISKERHNPRVYNKAFIYYYVHMQNGDFCNLNHAYDSVIKNAIPNFSEEEIMELLNDTNNYTFKQSYGYEDLYKQACSVAEQKNFNNVINFINNNPL